MKNVDASALANVNAAVNNFALSCSHYKRDVAAARYVGRGCR